ncbi:Ankyrin repeat and MYND domain-containing protein 2 [Elasticomyces elasticus]|nr:Ankyrin repeat and MYND domain-containing protein 2 [Elasticomyces elasticus]
MAVTIPKQCGHCGKSATTNCAQCKSVVYCDNKCQKKDWTVHKTICSSSLQDEVSEDSRPGSNYHRAILLPENGNRPEFVWVNQHQESCDLKKIIEADCRGVETIVDYGTGNDKHPNYQVVVQFRDEMLVDGTSKRNSLVSVLTKNNIAPYWRGPLLISGELKEHEKLLNFYADLEPCDLGSAVRGLVRFAKKWAFSVDRLKQKYGDDFVNKD